MKTNKLMALIALLGCLLLVDAAYAKSGGRMQAGYRLNVLQLSKFNKQLATDSADVTCWFDNGVPTNWTILFIGTGSTNGYYEFISDGSTGFLGRIPVGDYTVRLQCNDDLDNIEIDYYSSGPTQHQYTYSSRTSNFVFSSSRVDSTQGASFDFRPGF